MKQSKRFTLNKEDIKKWLKNALIFLAPLLVVLIPSIIKEIPSDWEYAAVALYILNILLDLLRKFIAGKK